MSRKLTPNSTLENLKREAKRWLAALRANAEHARARLERSYPDAPGEPSLRHVQHALAREHGVAGWAALKASLAAGVRGGDGQNTESLANTFLDLACADPILANGPASHARRARTALRMLERYPEIAHHNLHTAVVCGDVARVERILAERPDAATESGGPLRSRVIPERESLWTPLLHCCYGRLPLAAAADNAVAIARALLDRGANPNDYFEVGTHPNRYTALCGVAGEGEDDAPPHARRESLARLLLERGADPHDLQLFYNTHFHGDILWIVKLIHEHAITAGRQVDWDDPEWKTIGMRKHGYGMRYLLGNAVQRNKLELTEWLLSHGTNPDVLATPTVSPPERTLVDEAIRRGLTEMAGLLVRHGSPSSPPPAGDSLAAFTAACFRLDRRAALAILERRPEHLRSTAPIFAAAERDRADVVALLLDLGTPVDVADDTRQQALHVAAYHDAVGVAALLIARDADLAAVETSWNNTPLDAALYSNNVRMIELLCRHSRDVHRITWAGQIQRLRELLAAEPDLVAKSRREHDSPLMWLPDDDALAREAVELLLEYGADPFVRDERGAAAADLAERRALYQAARLLRSRIVR